MKGLNLLSDQPLIRKFIQSGEWKDYFPNRTLAKAQDYFRFGKIISIKLKTSRGLINLSGKVQGSYRHHYLADLDFIVEKKNCRIFTDCTCPVEIDCKHAAALLYQLSQELSGSSSSLVLDDEADFEIANWLTQFSETSSPDTKKPAKKSTDFLAYCIYEPLYGYEDSPALQLHKGKKLKNGTISINRGSNAAASPERPTAYMQDADIMPTGLFHHLTDQWNKSVSLTNPSALQLLRAAAATGRLYYTPQKKSAHPVTIGKTITIKPEWEDLPNGSKKPVLNISERALILTQSPPHLFCPPAPGAPLDAPASLHPIKSSFSPKQLIAWREGPTISGQKLAQTTQQLTQVAPKLPKPAVLKTKTLSKSKPTPHLHLHRANPYNHGGIHLSGTPAPIIATLSFEYHGHRATPDLSNPPPETASFTVTKDKTLLTIPRDIQAEVDIFQLLYPEHNLRPANAYHYDVHPAHLSALLPNAQVADLDFAWADFFIYDQPLLEAAGWTITIDPSAELQIQDIGDDQLHTGIEELPDHGIDWFQFQASYLTPEGNQRPLLPLLATYLQNINLDGLEKVLPDLPKDDKTVLKDPDTNAFIAVSTHKLCTLALTLRDLFGNQSPEAPLHRIQAADLADTLNLDSSQTLKDLATLGKNLKNITSLPQPKLPKSLQATLRDYQTEGFHWMQFLARHSLHGILADDMGLGKTLQTLTHLQAEVSSRRTQKKPSLVIAPTSVVGNWINEAAKFTPKLKTLLLQGPDRKEHFKDIPKNHLIITSYALLVRDFEELKKHPFHLLVLDEAQYIKNPASKASQFACKIPAAHRVSLSGTPLENHLGELWSQMRFLMPGLLGSAEAFRKNFRTPIEKNQSTDAQKQLNARVAPLILRRTKDEVATELPPKTEIIHTIPLNSKQIDLYETIRAAMDHRIRDAIADKGLAKSQIIVLDALLKLRQICCHPQLLKLPAAKKIQDSAKLDFLTKELLPPLIEEGRRILIFSTFTSMLKLIQDHLEKEKIAFAKITGNTKNRQAQVDLFQKGGTPVFLISLKAGGTGLNLTAADTVIHYDPWWNPAAENQATDRAYRIGQDKPVFVHKLLCEGSIEQRIQELQNKKSALVDALLTDDTNKLKLDQSTLKNLLAPLA